MTAKRTKLSFLETYSPPLAARVVQMTPGERQLLLMKCLRRIPDSIRSVADVQIAIRSVEEEKVSSPEEIQALREKADNYLAKSIEADLLGDNVQSDFLNAVGCTLAGLKYLLESRYISEAVVDNFLYYITSVVEDRIETLIDNEHSP